MILLISVIAVLAVFFLMIMVADCNRFVIRNYRCKSKALKKDGTIILLSDLHNKSFGKNNEKLLTEIERIQPDMIWIAGDMYTSVKGGDTSAAKALVCTLAARYPVYYGNGNHEHKTRLYPEYFGAMYQEYADVLKTAGIRHLVNEKISLPSFNMDIYGIEIEREYYGKFKSVKMDVSYLEALLGKADPSRFSVLIAHNPDYFETYVKWGANLVVSGHVHGGLMRLPYLGGVISPAFKLFPVYDGGEFEKDGAVMILSRGLGTHTLPIRIFNPGELVVIRMTQS